MSNTNSIDSKNTEIAAIIINILRHFGDVKKEVFVNELRTFARINPDNARRTCELLGEAIMAEELCRDRATALDSDMAISWHVARLSMLLTVGRSVADDANISHDVLLEPLRKLKPEDFSPSRDLAEIVPAWLFG